MGVEENKKLLEHYTAVANGSVKSANSVRNELIVSDAKRHLADLIAKNPELIVEEVKEESKESKSKVKK